MLTTSASRLLAAVVMATGTVLPTPSFLRAQTLPVSKAPTATFSEAMTRAKRSSQPLIVFGMSEGCGYCMALKQGMASQPDLKLLLSQYVSIEVPFGGSEFKDIFYDVTRREETIRKEGKYRQSIGAPSVFIFTSAGDTVYFGPDRIGGIQPGDEFKKLLIQGIEKNGGLRTSPKTLPSPDLAADVAKARKLFSDGKPLAAAAILSKYLAVENSVDDKNDELTELTKFTGLKVTKPKTQEQLENLVQQVCEKGLSLVREAVAAPDANDGIPAAVQLVELERVFSGYPSFAGKFDAAWQQLLAKAKGPNLKEQAALIDQARQAESDANPDEAIAAYELVSATYPGTKAADLSQLRVAQLRAPKPGPSRVWKSKSGQFSVTAGLVTFDGKSAQLQTSDGKMITVALDALSSADQQFLKAIKPGQQSSPD